MDTLALSHVHVRMVQHIGVETYKLRLGDEQMVMACKHLQTGEIASNSNTHLVATFCNKYKQMRK